jgi:transcription initiation factor TFIID subunit 5
VQFHPNSLYLATGSHDKSVRMWDVQRGACVRLLMGHTDSVSTIAISPDGRTLASAGESGGQILESRSRQVSTAQSCSGIWELHG